MSAAPTEEKETKVIFSLFCVLLFFSYFLCAVCRTKKTKYAVVLMTSIHLVVEMLINVAATANIFSARITGMKLKMYISAKPVPWSSVVRVARITTSSVKPR